MKKFSELNQEEINAMSDDEFKNVSPFEKKSCADCIDVSILVNAWCKNERAQKDRGTAFAGIIKCPYWSPNWECIDEKYKTEENGYTAIAEEEKQQDNKEANINLGRKSFWWMLRVFFLSPVWFFWVSKTKQTWSEFKSGQITHKCSFDYDNPIINKHGKHYKCKHYGCNIVSLKNKNGTFTFFE